MTGLTDEEMMELVSPRGPEPGVGYASPGYGWRQIRRVEPDTHVDLRSDAEWSARLVDLEADQLKIANLEDKRTSIGRMRMALTEAGRPDMAKRLEPINGNWWIPDDSAPDTAKLIKDYEREPTAFEFICRSHWVSVQRMRDYEVIDPNTGQRQLVSAARWQGEGSMPGWANLITDIRKAMS